MKLTTLIKIAHHIEKELGVRLTGTHLQVCAKLERVTENSLTLMHAAQTIAVEMFSCDEEQARKIALEFRA